MDANLTKDLVKLIRETPSAAGKSNLMRAMGTIREAAHETSSDPKDLRLAYNCYNAATRFYKRAIGQM